MKFDGALLAPDLHLVPELVKELESLGYDGVFTFEGPHEPFLPLLLAAEHSQKLEIATGLAIAFARNPMNVANLAWDLQAYSKGRLVLGLGTQIKAHVERRYGMPWGKPIARMREFVLALKAIFAAWNEGERLDFRGEFYTHTLMPPLFSPGPNPYGRPPILLGGVGAKATALAGEVADGLLVHPFHTARFLETVTLPSIDEGLARSGRTRNDFTLACQTLIVTGADEDDFETAKSATKNQIAFYASTPAYKPVLDAEGWGDLQAELQAMTKQGAWAEMAERIDDAMLARIAIVGTPEEVGDALRARYGAIAQRVAFASPYPLDPVCVRRVLARYRSA